MGVTVGAFFEEIMAYYDVVDPATADYVAVASVEEVPSGARKLLEVDGRAIAVFNIAGTYYCIADVCSHDDGPVAEGELVGTEIECPRHGARFDVRTGKVLSFPAIVDIPSYPVRVEDGSVLVGLPPAE
jgi:3-phenylpropionate/trans-cinnamate dioxygenase ferredoxin subunit